MLSTCYCVAFLTFTLIRLTAATRDIVRGTAPVLKAHGLALTRHFYARMFEHNPELKAIFNQGHQREGSQQQALAMAVAAYAEHIDAPQVLMPVLQLIAHKHVSLGIRAEHYAIVGRHLLASIREVLGEEAATPALLAAWAEAYEQLAQVLIGLEADLYRHSATRPGGWTGWRGFRVQRKQAESDEICSLYLVPADGGAVPDYLPGQYISVRVLVPELGYSQPRQYSLSAAPGGEALRISVKREHPGEARPEGMVSTHLHEQVHAGNVIDVAPPMGDFVLHTERTNPVVLISAGVGLTPMVAMFEHLARHTPQRPVTFLHACRHAGVHAFREHVAALAAEHPRATVTCFYERPTEGAAAHLALPPHRPGRMVLDALDAPLPVQDGDFYVCGPRPFMAAQIACLQQLGVAPARIHAEVFGTGGV